MTELVIRFLIGGAVVSLFAAIAELFQPKTFSGLFGAAPTVALATLAFTYADDGPAATATAGRWMLIASIAMLCYCVSCAVGCRARRVPIAVLAFGGWLVWLGCAGLLWLALRGLAS